MAVAHPSFILVGLHCLWHCFKSNPLISGASWCLHSDYCFLLASSPSFTVYDHKVPAVWSFCRITKGLRWEGTTGFTWFNLCSSQHPQSRVPRTMSLLQDIFQFLYCFLVIFIILLDSFHLSLILMSPGMDIPVSVHLRNHRDSFMLNMLSTETK